MHANCGVGKTFDWQIQSNVYFPPAPGFWHNEDTGTVTVPASLANHMNPFVRYDTSFMCSQSKFYRLRVTWQDGADVSPYWLGQC